MKQVDKELAIYYKLKALAQKINKKYKIITIIISSRIKKDGKNNNK